MMTREERTEKLTADLRDDERLEREREHPADEVIRRIREKSDYGKRLDDACHLAGVIAAVEAIISGDTSPLSNHYLREATAYLRELKDIKAKELSE